MGRLSEHRTNSAGTTMGRCSRPLESARRRQSRGELGGSCTPGAQHSGPLVATERELLGTMVRRAPGLVERGAIKEFVRGPQGATMTPPHHSNRPLPTFGRSTNLGQHGQICPDLGQHCPGCDHRRTDMTELGPNSARVGPGSPRFGRMWPNSARFQPTLARPSAEFVRQSLARHRPTLDDVERLLPELGARPRPALADLGWLLPDQGQVSMRESG